ncbi:MAG TPA: M14 family murein peptide amidase A [Mariprofundaceae bacterium]|nr:M14 family murein peptide amidase A [Mariprofundaceae bacterium]
MAVCFAVCVLLFAMTGCHRSYPPPAPQNHASKAPDPVIEQCTRIGNKLGSVKTKECLENKLMDTGARSVNGQAILMREYAPLPSREPISRVLLIGGTHGDEYASVSTVFKWMQTLDAHHSGMFHWHVAPLVNPDGLLREESQRLNAHGVDLNRNMPTPEWHEETRKYWNRVGKDPRRYPGKAPLSEPESRWLYEEIRSFKPHVIISVHAPFGVLDFDGPPTGPRKLGYLHLKLIGTYPGSLGNCAGVQHQIPVITVELPHAGIMPSRSEISRMWTDIVVWLRKNTPKQKTIDAYAIFDETTKQMITLQKVVDGSIQTPHAEEPRQQASERKKRSEESDEKGA